MRQFIIGLIVFLLLPFACFSEEKEVVLSILNFKDIKLPDNYFEKPVTARSDLKPFTCEDLYTLLEKKVGSGTIKNLVKSRGSTCDPSAENIGKLKEKGSTDELLAAVSEFALSPNEVFDLIGTFNFFDYEGADLKGEPFVHLVLHRKKLKPITVIDDLGRILQAKWMVDTIEQYQEGMLNKKVRKIAFVIPIKFRDYGKTTLDFYQSKAGTPLKGPQLKTMQNAKHVEFEYPQFSRKSQCTLDVDFSHDVALKGKWQIKDAEFECDWGM